MYLILNTKCSEAPEQWHLWFFGIQGRFNMKYIIWSEIWRWKRREGRAKWGYINEYQGALWKKPVGTIDPPQDVGSTNGSNSRI